MDSEIFKKIGIVFFMLLVFGWLLVIASQFSILEVGVVHVDPIVKRALSPNLLSGNVVGIAGDKTIPVIITLKEDALAAGSAALQEDIIKENQEKVLETLEVVTELPADGIIPLKESPDLILTYQYTTINALAGEITAGGLEKLEQNPAVESIVYDYPITISLDTSVPLVGAAAVQSLSVNGNLIQGDGETVCVIDTGIDYTHPALGGCTTTDFLAGSCAKVIAGYDVADADSDPKDVNSHGSHVAGIVASTDATYTGVAPAAKLVAVKVFPGSSGSTNVSNVIAGIDWCKNNAAAYNISIITLSLGDGSQHNSDCDDDILASAANSAVDAGIFVDVASGNNGYSSGVGVPACGSKVAAVGWTDDSDNIASGSNSGLILDLLAPGSSITSTRTGSGFLTLSGTSMAAPHVAGAAALLRQYWKQAYGVTLTPAEVMTILTENGLSLLDSRNGLTFPRIDILAAVQPHLLFTANSIANGSVVADPAVFMEGTADVPLAAAILEWDYNNGTKINYTMTLLNTTQFSYNLTGLTSGVYTYALYGSNAAGTTGVSAIRSMTVNIAGSGTTTPIVSINNPSNNGFIGVGQELFSATVSGTFTIDTVLFQFVNGTNPFSVGAQNVNGVWQAAVDAELLAEGAQQVTVFANDSFGNINNTESVLFTVDKVVPALFDFQAIPQEMVRSGSILFTVNATDSYLDNSSLRVETNIRGVLTNYTLGHDSGDRYGYTLSGNISTPAVYTARFYVFDQAGNGNVSDALSLTVLNQIPSVTITMPSNGATVEVGTGITFTAVATDADNDALTYQWNISGTAATGSSIAHTFTATGSAAATVTVSDSYNQSVAAVAVTVIDTQPPNLTSLSYDASVHLESDGSQVVNVVASDYSGILDTILTANTVPYPASCSKGSTSWACSWTLANLTIGSKNFTISTTDNYTTLHSRVESYSFAVTSCSDGVENGDEDGLDCGGSCSLDCPATGDSSSDDGSGSAGSGGAGGSSSGAEGSSEDFSTTEASEESVEESSAAETTEENEADNPEPVAFTETSDEQQDTQEFSLGKITGGVVSFMTGKINKKVYSLVALVIFILILIAALYYVMRPGSGGSLSQEELPRNKSGKQQRRSRDDYI